MKNVKGSEWNLYRRQEEGKDVWNRRTKKGEIQNRGCDRKVIWANSELKVWSVIENNGIDPLVKDKSSV